VIAIDTNIIVYARRAELPHHRAARALLAQLAHGATPWAIPWPCLYEYIKVVTNPHLFRPPDTLADALADVESLVASPSVVLLGHGPEHVRHLRRAADDGHYGAPPSPRRSRTRRRVARGSNGAVSPRSA